jgi:hypothetical protein
MITFNGIPSAKQVHCHKGAHGGAVVEALRYKPEGRRIDS